MGRGLRCRQRAFELAHAQRIAVDCVRRFDPVSCGARDLDLRRIRLSLRFDELRIERAAAALLALEDVGDDVVVDERGVFAPDLQLRGAETASSSPSPVRS